MEVQLFSRPQYTLHIIYDRLLPFRGVSPFSWAQYSLYNSYIRPLPLPGVSPFSWAQDRTASSLGLVSWVMTDVPSMGVARLSSSVRSDSLLAGCELLWAPPGLRALCLPPQHVVRCSPVISGGSPSSPHSAPLTFPTWTTGRHHINKGRGLSYTPPPPPPPDYAKGPRPPLRQLEG